MICVLIAAGCVRFWNLGSKSLWTDEAVSAILATSSVSDFWQIITRHEPNMTFYYAALRAEVFLFGDTEAALRSLSVAAGILSVLALYRLGKQLFDERTGRIVALLVALSPLHISYSQEARSYSFLILFSILATSQLIDGLDSGRFYPWCGYVAASTLGMYSHVLFALVLASHVAVLGLSPRRKLLCPHFIGALASVTALSMPLAYWMLVGSPSTSHIAWITETPLHGLASLITSTAGPDGQALLTIYALLVVSAVYMARRNFAESKLPVLCVLLAVPILISFAVSWHTRILIPRYLSFSLPPFLLLVGRGIALMPNRWLFVSSYGIVVSLSLQQDFLYQRLRANPGFSDDWRGTVYHVAENAQAGDSMVFPYAFERIPVYYYLERDKNEEWKQTSLFPESSVQDLMFQPMPELTDARIAQLALQHKRIWTLSAIAPNEHILRVQRMFPTSCVPSTMRNFGTVHVELMVCGP